MTTIKMMSLKELYEKLNMPWDGSLDKLIEKYDRKQEDETFSDGDDSKSGDSANKVKQQLKNIANAKSYETDDDKNEANNEENSLYRNSRGNNEEEENRQRVCEHRPANQSASIQNDIDI